MTRITALGATALQHFSSIIWAIACLIAVQSSLRSPSCFIAVNAALLNITFDDSYGNDQYGELEYVPAGGWSAGEVCSGCNAKPDSSNIYNHTWHIATANSTLATSTKTMRFTWIGTALYVFCIIPNNATTVTLNYNFVLDDDPSGVVYEHKPSSNGSYEYDVMVYSISDLPLARHSFELNLVGGKDFQSGNVVMFDYLVYTRSNDPNPVSSTSNSPGSPSPTSPLIPVTNNKKKKSGAIIGGAVGGALGFILICFLAIALSPRRRGGNRSARLAKESDAAQPPPPLYVEGAAGEVYDPWGQHQQPSQPEVQAQPTPAPPPPVPMRDRISALPLPLPLRPQTDPSSMSISSIQKHHTELKERADELESIVKQQHAQDATAGPSSSSQLPPEESSISSKSKPQVSQQTHPVSFDASPASVPVPEADRLYSLLLNENAELEERIRRLEGQMEGLRGQSQPASQNHNRVETPAREGGLVEGGWDVGREGRRDRGQPGGHEEEDDGLPDYASIAPY